MSAIPAGIAIEAHGALASEHGGSPPTCGARRYSLAELVDQITDKNLPDLVNWGPPEGSEEW